MDTARALGKGAQFEFAGETYDLAPWNFDVRAGYEKYFVARAIANLRAQRAELPDGEYEEERRALRQDVDAGDYAFGKSLVMRSLQDVENQKHLLYLCLAWPVKDTGRSLKVTKDLVDRIAADPAKFEEAIELMVEVNRDPNRPTPGGPGTGGS